MESGNLRRVCDEVFHSNNLIDDYTWVSNFRPDNSSAIHRENAQHILCYARDKSKVSGLVGAQKKSEGLPSLTKNSMPPTTLRFEPEWVDFLIDDGHYQAGDLGNGYVLTQDVEISAGRAQQAFSLTGRMIWSQEYLEDQIKDGTRIVIKTRGFVPYTKKASTADLAPTTLIPPEVVGDGLSASAEVRELFGAAVFNHPKPTTLLEYLISSVTYDDPDAIVLDFFAGSSTTADAVMRTNAKDNGRRKFIMIQIAEDLSGLASDNSKGAAAKCARNAMAYLHGIGRPPRLTELSRQRIVLAARRLSDVSGENLSKRDAGLDLGFRYLRVDSSNMNDVLATPDEVSQTNLFDSVSNVKTDRTGEDLIFQVLLDWGLPLDVAIEVEDIEGQECFVVEGGALIACFEPSVSGTTVRGIAQREPVRAVFRDEGFASDAERINAEQVFKEFAPLADVKVI